MRPSTVTRAYKRFVRVETLGVEVVAGPDRGKNSSAEGEKLTVGTADGNDLVLGDKTVSRYHLELVREADGARVVDLSSTNGTYVSGVRLERGIVQSGTVLEIGASQLRVIGGAPAVIPLHDSDALSGLRGRTPVMRRMMARIEKIAPAELTILLVGESGTGKELVARAIHERSSRAGGPFVTVDCGAMSSGLVSSELFGHERGSFTGADSSRQGAFERAHGGTLFLDEIGELHAELQSYLLGTLERRRFRRVGGRTDIDVDVRVVSATNRDLRSEVNAGNFRLDLYHRIAAACVELPPLRARPDDIPLLIEHFVREAGSDAPIESIVPQTEMARLLNHNWPGNVRELRNVVEAALAMGESVALTGDVDLDGALPPAMLAGLCQMSYGDARAAVLRDFERNYLAAILERAKGNVSRAAREAGMNRSHLIELLRRREIR